MLERASMRTRIVPALLAATALLLSACIERPPSPRARRDGFDRSRLGDVLMTSAPPATGPNAIFGDSVQLVRVETNPERPRRGDTVEVTFFYKVLEEADESYKVFVHIDPRGGEGGRINGDHWPAGERYPTDVWRRGEVVRDTWSFRVPSSYRANAIELWTGFYVPGKDDRWPVTNRSDVRHDGNNRVLAHVITLQ